MALICIFHDQVELRHAKTVAALIEAAHHTVWFADRDSSGNWRSDVETTLRRQDCVGAVVIWSDSSLRNQIVIEEAEATVRHNKTLLSLVLEGILPPLGLRSATRVLMPKWDGSPDHPDLSSVQHKILRMAMPAENAISRIHEVVFDRRRMRTPAFVFSVSSFETQISPTKTLELLNLFPPPAVLVSAYDVLGVGDNSPEFLSLGKALDELASKDTIIFLDSGNYEAYRLANEWWQRSPWLLKEATGRLRCDVVFSHDRIIEIDGANDRPPTELAERVIKEVERDAISTGRNSISPIVHAPRSRDGTYRSALLPTLCEIVAKNRRPPLIAVPERELGDGILERARRVRTIRRALDRVGFDQPLHILGTGNPLSILILAMAGGDVFDGLEWCRTVADGTTMRLHHFHQFDLFLRQRSEIQDERLREYLAAQDELLTAKAKAVLHNLYFFQRFMGELQQAHRQGDYEDLFDRYLPGEYGRIMKRIETEDAA